MADQPPQPVQPGEPAPPSQPAQPAHPGQPTSPAWRRATRGESRWSVTVAILAAIGLQVSLPAHVGVNPRWLVAAAETGLLVAHIAANPRRFERHSRGIRAGSLALIITATAANAWSAGQLVHRLVVGRVPLTASSLLLTGGAIWLTNVIAFGLWYWELDRGGPVVRSQGVREHTDFLFPQMATPELAPHDWEPAFIDYLYVSFTNAAAFSPTDVLPLSRWAKVAMLIQSLVSLTTVALLIARAVNTLR